MTVERRHCRLHGLQFHGRRTFNLLVIVVGYYAVCSVTYVRTVARYEIRVSTGVLRALVHGHVRHVLSNCGSLIVVTCG